MTISFRQRASSLPFRPTVGTSIQGQFNLLGDLVGRQKQSLIEVNIALGDAPPGVSQQAGDCQL